MSFPALVSLPQPMTQVWHLDSVDRSELLRVVLMSDGVGVCEAPEQQNPRIILHVGKPVYLDCMQGSLRHSGIAIHGDIDIVPAGTAGRWEIKEPDTALVLKLDRRLLREVGEECGYEDDVQVLNRFRARDPQVEHIGWALMSEVQQGYPSGRLFLDSMARALAVQVLRNHSSASRPRLPADGGMPRHKLRTVVSYIEENLRSDLSLNAIAEAAGMSPSHLKATFRQTMGLPVHQYVIRRRVDRAAELLRRGSLPVSQVALECGFTHQSHLALHMKRLLGVTPKQVR